MSRDLDLQGAVAAFCVVVSTGAVRADTYSVLDSTTSSILRGATIESEQIVDLQRGETVSFVVRSDGASLQRKCVGPYKGQISRCTNHSPGLPVGIPGGSRGSDD